MGAPRGGDTTEANGSTGPTNTLWSRAGRRVGKDKGRPPAGVGGSVVRRRFFLPDQLEGGPTTAPENAAATTAGAEADGWSGREQHSGRRRGWGRSDPANAAEGKGDGSSRAGRRSRCGRGRYGRRSRRSRRSRHGKTSGCSRRSRRGRRGRRGRRSWCGRPNRRGRSSRNSGRSRGNRSSRDDAASAAAAAPS